MKHKAYKPLQASIVLAKKGLQEKIKHVLLNSPCPNCSISQPATDTYKPFDVSNDTKITNNDWDQRIKNLSVAYKNRVQLVIEGIDIYLLQLIPIFSWKKERTS